MASERANFDWGTDFDDANYKSCFARSVAVNSQYKQMRTSDAQQPEKGASQESPKRPERPPPAIQPVVEGVKLRKSSQRAGPEDRRRLSCGARRASVCASEVESLAQRSRVATLQWQLREVEKSREMYRAVMRQVVGFLERAHRSLGLLGAAVPRSKSEQRIAAEAAFGDLTWRRPKKQEVSSEEVPPEKLSQEAFRLLRTAQSLLNTQEPKLASDEDDLEFLARLAEEFPQPKPHRTTSFSLSPKLLTPEKETKIATAFNRKLSLQLNETRRTSYKYTHGDFSMDGFAMENPKSNYRGFLTDSFTAEKPKFKPDSDKSNYGDFVTGSFTAEKPKLKPDSEKSNYGDFLTDSFTVQKPKFKQDSEKSNYGDFLTDSFTVQKPKFKQDSEKSNSPPAGSISSVEDESGFSSMNSFQDVGLPLVGEEVTVKNALLRSMLHNNVEHLNGYVKIGENVDKSVDEDIKLWQSSDKTSHRRWSSTPVSCSTKQSVNVLWV